MTRPAHPPAPTTSVALTTWNGARHLPEQLQSILEQVCPPDEVVVRDDGSDDGTVTVLEAFAASAPFPVRVLPSGPRLGIVGNVSTVVAACTGDVVVPCDQDDRWAPTKLQQVVDAIAATPDAELLLSDAELIDDRGDVVATSLWERLGFTPTDEGLFHQLLTKTFVPGATIAFRRRHPLLLPLPPDLPALGLLHDGWIELVLAAVGPAVVLPVPLQAYRLHDGQAMGLSKATGTGSRRGDLARRRAQAERLRSHLGGEAPAATAELDAALVHLGNRLALPRRRPARLPALAREWRTGSYRRWSSGARSAYRDLLEP